MQRPISTTSSTATSHMIERIHLAKLPHRQLHRPLRRLRCHGICGKTPCIRPEDFHSRIHIDLRAAAHHDPGSRRDELFRGRQTQPRRAPHEDDVLAGKGMHVE